VRDASPPNHDIGARWDPRQYELFARERSLPLLHLLAAVPESEVGRIADLGCGSGMSTLELARRWPSATIWAVDTSHEMLDQAHHQALLSNVRFIVADIAAWRAPEPLDLIVSNAVLHWIDDHQRLLAHVTGQLGPAGTLAFQVPNNFSEPSHRLLYELTEETPWRERLTPLRRAVVQGPRWYQTCLAELGFESIVWESTYYHLLTGDNPVLAWTRGATLRPILAALDDGQAERFASEYARRLSSAYPPGPRGTVLPFRRIFVVAHRSRGEGADTGLHWKGIDQDGGVR
jgi:trans-aconitate 2-methyltransferase